MQFNLWKCTVLRDTPKILNLITNVENYGKLISLFFSKLEKN